MMRARGMKELLEKIWAQLDVVIVQRDNEQA
jgi:hypothetical protein